MRWLTYMPPFEAMKMEAALHAEHNGTIAEVLVRAGDQIDAKDLLLVLS
jgi:pyruvate carboxylase